MRTYVYVDGFNLYYGALKRSPYRWLDIKALSSQLIPATHQILKIRYFTARVSGATDATLPQRQAVYLNALKTIPEIELHFGSFLAKTIWRPVVNLPIAGQAIVVPPAPIILLAGQHVVASVPPRALIVGTYPAPGARHGHKRKPPHPPANAVVAEVHTMEEKGSDVNLAVNLLNDAWKDVFDAAVVISNDTDLVAPIRMVTQERQKPVFLVCPGRWTAAPKLVSVSTYVRHIRPRMLAASQFPDPIPNTTIRKPVSW